MTKNALRAVTRESYMLNLNVIHVILALRVIGNRKKFELKKHSSLEPPNAW